VCHSGRAHQGYIVGFVPCWIAHKKFPFSLSLRFAWVLVLCIAQTAIAQRMQFPSPTGPYDPYAPSGGYSPTPYSPAPGSYPVAPNPYPSIPSAPGPYASPYPAGPSPAFDPYAAGPSGPPLAPYSPPGAMPYAPGTTPYSSTPSSIFPPSPYGAGPGAGSSGGPSSFNFSDWLTPAPNGERFIREIRVQDTWLAPLGGDKSLGVDDLDLSLTFQFPFPFFETRQATSRQRRLARQHV
jgi:hypothetical protein